MLRSLSSLSVAFVIGILVMGAAHRAPADSGIVATVTYTGDLGPVSSARPLCLCVYLDADLQSSLGCAIAWSNPNAFQISLSPRDYFLIAFLDLDDNERPDSNEPFEIYHDRFAPPADPVTAGPERPAVALTFGDQSLTPIPSPSVTPTETPTPTWTVTPAPTATPTPTSPAQACVGDCDGSGEVTVDELLILVNIALGNTPLQACAEADTDGSDAIEVNEILVAVNHALAGCRSPVAGS
jgi:hypothetical protein